MAYWVESRNGESHAWPIRSVGALLYIGELERRKRIAVVAIQRREDRSWAFPAGRVDETDLTGEYAIQREVGEELGLIIPIDQIRLFAVDHTESGEAVRCVYAVPVHRSQIFALGKVQRCAVGRWEKWCEVQLHRPTEEVDRLAVLGAGDMFSRFPPIYPMFRPRLLWAVRYQLERMSVI